MIDEFEQAALTLFTGEHDKLAALLNNNGLLATHTVDTGHKTLLQIVACEEQHLPNPAAAATLLIEAGAATTGPVVSAAGCNSPKTLLAMLQAGVPVDADDEWTPLDEALYWNNVDMVKLLQREGASTNRLRRAAGLGELDLVDAFFDGRALRSHAGPLHSWWEDTIGEGEAEDPQAIVNHAFVMAVNCGHRAAAEILLDRGAEINTVPPGYHWRGTALHGACWRGNETLVRWLMGIGADPTIRDGLVDADAPGWAEHHKHPELVPLLVR